MRLIKLLPILLLSLPAAGAMAQAAAPAPRPALTTAARPQPALSAEEQAKLAKQDAEMTQQALRVAQQVDAGRMAEVWEGASVVARRSGSSESFVTQVGGDRARLGALVSRGNASVTRVQYPAGAAVPEGLYLNVSFPTRFANNAQPVRELISFRLDEDRVWRVSGYSVRAAGK